MLFAESGPSERLGLLLALSVAGSALGIGAANLLSRRRPTGHVSLQCSDRARPASPQASGWLMGNKLKAILCLIYVLSPIDLMPEAVLGPLGLADDVVAAI